MYLTITNLGHHGHMTWYILNILDNIPSQDVLVTSVWYILNVLNICWFGMLLVLRPRPYNVLAMYQVSTSPLAPSGINFLRPRFGRETLELLGNVVSLSFENKIAFTYLFRWRESHKN